MFGRRLLRLGLAIDLKSLTKLRGIHNGTLSLGRDFTLLAPFSQFCRSFATKKAGQNTTKPPGKRRPRGSSKNLSINKVEDENFTISVGETPAILNLSNNDNAEYSTQSSTQTPEFTAEFTAKSKENGSSHAQDNTSYVIFADEANNINKSNIYAQNNPQNNSNHIASQAEGKIYAGIDGDIHKQNFGDTPQHSTNNNPHINMSNNTNNNYNHNSKTNKFSQGSKDQNRSEKSFIHKLTDLSFYQNIFTKFLHLFPLLYKYTKIGFRYTFDYIKLCFTNPKEAYNKYLYVYRWSKEGLHHLWLNTKIFYTDIKTGFRLGSRYIRGFELTRRENLRLQQALGDCFRMVPFSLFVIVPFLEFTLPFFLTYFPTMLPTAFQGEKDKNKRLQTLLNNRLKVAELLQDTLEHIAGDMMEKKSELRPSVEELMHIINLARNGELVDSEKIIHLSSLFKDDITIDNMNRSQLSQLCRLMDIKPFGTDSILRIRLRNKIRGIMRDDRTIIQEGGIESLTPEEISQACEERCISTLNLPNDLLKKQLIDWIDLSTKKNVPVTLLIMSRIFQPSHAPDISALASSLSDMGDEVVNEVVVKSGNEENIIELKEQVLDQKLTQNELIESERRQNEQYETLVENKQLLSTGDDQAISVEKLERLKSLASADSLLHEHDQLLEIKEKFDRTSKMTQLSMKKSVQQLGEYLAQRGTDRLQRKLDKMLDKLERDVEVASESIPHTKILDTNSDGIIERYELKEALSFVLDKPISDEFVKDVTNHLGVSRPDGKFTLKELDDIIEKLKIEQSDDDIKQ